MPREIVLQHKGAETCFGFEKVSRAKLYGRKRRVQLDSAGATTKRASIACDGAVIVQSGMTGQGYFDEAGVQYSRRDLVGLAPDGTELPLQKSTFNVAQALREVSPTELLDVRVSAIYSLTSEALNPELAVELEAGKVFHFPFNYSTDYVMEDGFLVQNDHGIFGLIGQSTSSEWIGQEVVAVPIVEDEEEDDDLDFEMF
jgi:hypothetical protein